MTRRRSLSPLLLVLSLIAPGVVWAAGSTPEEGISPAEKAEDALHRAARYREEAQTLEAEAAGLEGEAAAKKLGKASKEYEKAARSLRAALEHDPNLYQAHSDLGFALRKLGDYEAALEAYGRALELSPGYPEAIEYRAEAYLGLARFEEAQAAYMELLRSERFHADELLTAMRRWVDARGVDPQGTEAAAVEEFARWVEERERAAGQTADLGAAASASDW
jgi:tetratricopeptide (TPR) repeat protein